ncbi:Alpha-1,3-mannosyltransferase CMT1 [Galdieria sulphuraria]|nr:Alpha-1,3-mannosyltransferase CMT1 [Galdieria sulphuraria]
MVSLRRTPLFCSSVILSSLGEHKEKLSFPSLKADSFRHPIDLVSTNLLRRVVGLEVISRRLINPFIEKLFLLENLSVGIQVSSRQLPELYALLVQACSILNIYPYPSLFLRQSPYPNAYTLAFQGEKPFIVIHSSLLDILTEAELQVVLAHELGHLKCEHGVWLTLANSFAILCSSFGAIGFPLSNVLERHMTKWFQAAEFSCDRASLLVSQDLFTVTSTIMKLAGGSSSIHHQLDVREYMRQAEEFTRESEKGFLSQIASKQLAEVASHPLPVVRITELNRWSTSLEYTRLLRTGRPLVKE